MAGLKNRHIGAQQFQGFPSCHGAAVTR
jgi:hypothetical protein